jgi:hypothetical protein
MTIDANLRRKETAFKIAADELLAKNVQVRNLPNIADRQAQININLRDEHRDIEELKNDVRELDHLEKMVKMVHRELKDTMGEIKLQRALVRDELDSGRMYGDERNSAYTGKHTPEKPMLDDIDEEEINSLMKGEGTIKDPLQADIEVEPSAVIEEEKTPPDPISEEQKIENFLTAPPEILPMVVASLPTTSALVSTDEFADLLDNV